MWVVNKLYFNLQQHRWFICKYIRFVIYIVQRVFDLKSIREKYCFKCLDSINYPTQKFSSTHEIKAKGKRKT